MIGLGLGGAAPGITTPSVQPAQPVLWGLGSCCSASPAAFGSAGPTFPDLWGLGTYCSARCPVGWQPPAHPSFTALRKGSRRATVGWQSPMRPALRGLGSCCSVTPPKRRLPLVILLHAGPNVCQPCKASEAAVWHAAPATEAGSSQLIHVATLTSELLFGTPRPQ